MPEKPTTLPPFDSSIIIMLCRPAGAAQYRLINITAEEAVNLLSGILPEMQRQVHAEWAERMRAEITAEYEKKQKVEAPA